MGVAVGISIATGGEVGVAVGISIATGGEVGVAVGISIATGGEVGVAVGISVATGVEVGVAVGISVAAGVEMGVAVFDGAGGLALAGVAATLADGVWVRSEGGAAVTVAVGPCGNPVPVGVFGSPPHATTASRASAPQAMVRSLLAGLCTNRRQIIRTG